MDKSGIERNLQLLAHELAVSGRTGAILILGGAVMVLVVSRTWMMQKPLSNIWA